MNDVLADRYELESVLGSGGMARVWLADDRLLHRKVAVKLLRDDVEQVSSGGSVLSEARAAAALSHRNAVAVYDVGRSGDRPFIVMELVEGCSLAELLARRGSLPPAQVVGIAAQTLDALEAAHERELVHRDVKPANILLLGCRVPEGLGSGATVKLADFGIAKAVRAAAGVLTQAGQVLGTPTYLSPEQVGGRSATPASDLYALGVVMYEMLAGRPPFAAETPVGTAMAHQHDEPDRLDRVAPETPQGLVDVVHRALEKDPEARWDSASQMRAALERWRDDEPIAPTLVAGAGAAGAAGAAAGAGAVAMAAAADSDDDEGVVRGGAGSRMAGWRPVVTVATVALLLVALVVAVNAWQSRTPADTAAEPTEEPAAVAEPEPEPTPTPTPTPTPEPTQPPDDADDEAGDGLLPSLPDPTSVSVDQVEQVVRNLPQRLVGERRDDLADGLGDVSEAPQPEQPQEAVELTGNIEEWVSDGELSSRVGQFVTSVLGRLIDSPA